MTQRNGDCRYEMAVRDRMLKDDGWIRCDAFGCDERHPLEHEDLGEECFGTGRWLGWIYVDLNRPDLFPRDLRFCSVQCAQWWFDREVITRHTQPLSPLDEALRAPNDVLKRKRAMKARHAATAAGGTQHG